MGWHAASSTAPIDIRGSAIPFFQYIKWGSAPSSGLECRQSEGHIRWPFRLPPISSSPHSLCWHKAALRRSTAFWSYYSSKRLSLSSYRDLPEHSRWSTSYEITRQRFIVVKLKQIWEAFCLFSNHSLSKFTKNTRKDLFALCMLLGIVLSEFLQNNKLNP